MGTSVGISKEVRVKVSHSFGEIRNALSLEVAVYCMDKDSYDWVLMVGLWVAMNGGEVKAEIRKGY